MDQGARLATELQAAYGLGDVDGLAALVRVRQQLDADIAVRAAGFDGRRRIVLGARSRKVDLGRSERCFTGAAREAVMQRDGHCQHPGCDMPGVWCDVDHIKEWRHGG